MNNQLTIVSRKSRLALQQAELVRRQLLDQNPELNIAIIGIATSGDTILDQSLNKIGGKGLFVSELETYLQQGKADIAVHSMKDVPAQLAAGLELGAILSRTDARDVFVSEKYLSLQQLPGGSIVGTSSLRRQAQVLALRPDMQVVALRGNVETRLQKLISGQYAAIILAAAGLERLGLTQWLQQPLSSKQMLPAVGQGALGIEYNLARPDIKTLLTPLNDPQTAACVQAERAMNAILDGGCQAPIAGFARINGSILILQGLVADPNGKIIYRAEQTGVLQDASQIGKNVADQLLQQGAGKIIHTLKALWSNNAW